MKKRWNVMIATLCLVLCTGGCASESEEDYKTEAEKKLETEVKAEEKEYQSKLDAIAPAAYGNVEGLALKEGSYISVIGKSADGEYWEQVKKGAEQAAADINEELGYKGKDAVKVTYSGPSEPADVDEQVNILDEELARYPVGLSIAIADSKSCTVQFDLAAGNGIPVVAFDSGSDYQGLMAMVSTDNKGTAAEAAQKMAELLDGTGEVAVFAHDSKSMSAEEREAGFIEKLNADYPGITVSNIYHIDQLDETKKLIAVEKGHTEEEITDEVLEEITDAEVVKYILENSTNLKGCFATDGDMVQMVAEALESKEREDVALIGYDGNTEELEALENGVVDGLVIQNPFGMGYASVVASARAALELGNEAYINTGAMWVTKDNMTSDEVKKWLY